MFFLEVKRGAELVLTRELNGSEIRVGRGGDNDVELEGGDIGRCHARLYAKRRRFYVQDLGSENGTRVNGIPIARKRLAEGDRIRIGQYVLALRMVRQAESEAPTPGVRMLSGAERGRIFRIDRGTSIVGRAETAALRLADPAISLEHAAIVRDDKNIVHVRDLRSVNGTWVNDRACRDGKVLHAGDVVRFAHVQCRFDSNLPETARRLGRAHAVGLALVLVCFAGLTACIITRQPRIGAVVARANELVERGSYGEAALMVEKALKRAPAGDTEGRKRLAGLLALASGLLEADCAWNDLGAAVTNGKWRTVLTLSKKLAETHSPLSIDNVRNEQRRQASRRWHRASDAYFEARRALEREDVESAWEAFRCGRTDTNSWPAEFVALVREVEIEREGRDMCRRAELALRDGQPAEAITLLDSAPRDAQLAKPERRRLRKAAEDLKGAVSAVENLKKLAQAGEFEMIESAIFPDLRDDNGDITVLAHGRLRDEFVGLKYAALGLGRRYRAILGGYVGWNTRTLPRNEDLFVKWKDAHELVSDGIMLGRDIEKFQTELKTDAALSWMSGGAVDEKAGKLRTGLQERLRAWERVLVDYALRCLTAGQTRDCAIGLKLCLDIQPSMADRMLKRAGRTVGETVRGIESDLRDKALALHSEGYMLQYGSAARLRKMRETVRIGLPYDRHVQSALKEIEHAGIILPSSVPAQSLASSSVR